MAVTSAVDSDRLEIASGQRAAGALALQLEVAERRPADDGGLDAVGARAPRRAPARRAAARRGRAARSRSSTWPPSPRSRSWRGSSAAAARLALSAAAGERSPPVLTSTATSARVGSTVIEPWPSAHQRLRERRDLLPDAGVGERRRRLAQAVARLRASRAAPRRRRRARRAAAAAGRRRRPSAAHSARSAAISAAISASSALGGGGAQDQAERRVGPGHRRVGERGERGAAVGVAQAAGEVAAGGAGGQDRGAALQQQPRGDRRRLAGLGPAGDLHQQRPPGRGRLAAAQEAGRARRRGRRSTPPSALHRPAGHGAVDRLGARRRVGGVGVDQQVLQPAVDDQRRGVAAGGQRLDQDLAALHGARRDAGRGEQAEGLGQRQADDVRVGAADPGDEGRRRGPGWRSRRPCRATRRRRGRRRSRRRRGGLKRTAVSTARLQRRSPRRTATAVTTRCRRPESSARKAAASARVGGLAEHPAAERDHGVGGEHHVVGAGGDRRGLGARRGAARRRAAARRGAGVSSISGARMASGTIPTWASRSRRRGLAEARISRGRDAAWRHLKR